MQNQEKTLQQPSNNFRMDFQGDIVSELQHSLMNAHGVMKKMKAISRQLNASHTLLLMKQSTSNEQLAEYVQDVRMKLEMFQEEMIHQLTKSFQEKTMYLNTCLQQLHREEATIKQLCYETEGLLKKVSGNITPVQIQRGKTLLEAFKIITKDNSADIELEEDVICLDFVPFKSADEYSSFGSIRVCRNENTVHNLRKESSLTDINQNKLVSRSSQTEILFKDYCPFCGRSYSKGKKDVEIQASVMCVECGTEPDVDTKDKSFNACVADTFWQTNFCDLGIDSIDSESANRKFYLESLKSNHPPNVRLIRNVLENVGLTKRYPSDESSSSYPEEAPSKSSPTKLSSLSTKSCDKSYIANKDDGPSTEVLQTRKKMMLTGKKLKNMNEKHLEEIWNSSDEEMEEATARLSNPLTFAATVKHQVDGEKSNESDGSKQKKVILADTITKNYIPPPPPGFREIPALPDSVIHKEKTKTKKPMLAAESLSMLTGLINTAKAENVVNPPYINKKETRDNSDWWGHSPDISQNMQHISPIHAPTPSAKKGVTSSGSGGSTGSVPECWLNDESDSMTCNSITSTPKGQKSNLLWFKEQKPTEEEEEEFRLRRPSISLKTSPHAVKTQSDTNNNSEVVYEVNTDDSSSFQDIHERKIRIKSEPLETAPNTLDMSIKVEFKTELSNTDSRCKAEADSSGIVDSGWEEDSAISESKDSVKSCDDWIESTETATYIRGSEVWTETTTRKIPQPALKHPYASNSERCHNAKDDWETSSSKRKSFVHSLKDTATAENRKIFNAKEEWETSSKSDVRKPRMTQLNEVASNSFKETSNTQVRKPRLFSWNQTPKEKPAKELSRSLFATYIEKMSTGNITRILPPFPAKLVRKIGGKDIGLHFPIGVTTTSKGDIIVADTGNHLVKIFSPDGKLKLTVGTQLKPQMERPSAIVVNNTDEIFVKDDKCIRMFDTDRGVILKQIGYNQLSSPYGLAWTPEGHLLTLDVDKRNPRIVIFSQKGDLVNSFPYTPLQGKLPSTRCRFLDVSQNTLVVSDLGRHEVYITDLQGKMKSCFGRGGYGHGEFYEPSGVVVDCNGNMIIADSKNDRIQVFRPDGSFVCYIGFSEPIKRPSDIHLTDDGHLIVVNFLNHQLKIYKLGN